MCERSGVINIAIEGMMLTGAMIAVIFSSITGSLWLGLGAAVIASGILGVFLAILAIRFRVDQIIAGTAINIFALGITSFISQRFLQTNPELNSGGVFQKIAIPGLSQIPILGPIFFNQTPIVYLLFLTIIAIHFMLFYTRWGLRTRAVGEHPRAADTLGVNVFKIRYINVIIGGMIAGIGGAYFTIGSVGRFDESITAGKGFIGLAAMIFGRWTPFGAYGASLIFGFSDALQAKLQVSGQDPGAHPHRMAADPALRGDDDRAGGCRRKNGGACCRRQAVYEGLNVGQIANLPGSPGGKLAICPTFGEPQ